MKAPIERMRYSVEELGQALGVSTQTILNRIKSGQMKATRDGNRLWIRREDLLDYLSKEQAGAKKSGERWWKKLRPQRRAGTAEAKAKAKARRARTSNATDGRPGREEGRPKADH